MKKKQQHIFIKISLNETITTLPVPQQKQLILSFVPFHLLFVLHTNNESVKLEWISLEHYVFIWHIPKQHASDAHRSGRGSLSNLMTKYSVLQMIVTLNIVYVIILWREVQW